jgi:hypothetical protein
VRRLGVDAGRIEIADDFDAPLPDELLAAFEGRSEPEDEPWREQGPAGDEPTTPEGEDVTRPGS